MPTIKIADLTLNGQSEESIYGTIESLTATPSALKGRLKLLPTQEGVATW
jgi:hypothetical protein